MLLEKGRILFSSGEFDECEKLIRKSAELENEDQGITELYAYTLQKLGEFEKALGYWNILLATHMLNSEYYCERGICKFHLGFRSALEDMDKALELDPDNPYRYSSKAYILDKLGRTEEAYLAYLRASDLDPTDEITQNNLGIIEYKLGYTSDSRKRFLEQEDRLGISKIQSGPSQEKLIPQADVYSKKRSTKWIEIKKMLSSWGEFRSFLAEALKLYKDKKSQK